MTTYTLTLTPPGAPHTVEHGLSRDEAFRALADLLYGTDISDHVDSSTLNDERAAA